VQDGCQLLHPSLAYSELVGKLTDMDNRGHHHWQGLA
jgi:hypothetical protein